jgi:hypothetical protein
LSRCRPSYLGAQIAGNVRVFDRLVCAGPLSVGLLHPACWGSVKVMFRPTSTWPERGTSRAWPWPAPRSRRTEVCSQGTADLAQDVLASVESRDLGEHRLRDLSRAERVFQVCGSGLRLRGPALREVRGDVQGTACTTGSSSRRRSIDQKGSSHRSGLQAQLAQGGSVPGPIWPTRLLRGTGRGRFRVSGCYTVQHTTIFMPYSCFQ